MTAQTHRSGAPPSGPRGTTPLLTRYVALVAGRRTKWVVVVFWLLLIGVGGSLATKIGSVENNDAQTWLPANAESTHALSIADQHFTNMNLSTPATALAVRSPASRENTASGRASPEPSAGHPVRSGSALPWCSPGSRSARSR